MAKKSMAKTMLFYNSVTPLSRDEHRNLKFKPLISLKFAEDTNFIPIAGQEFISAALDFPILFTEEVLPDGAKQFMPFVLTGMSEGKNDFVDAKGNWASGVYMPAFVRRYPYILASADAGAEEFAVCADLECDGFNEKDGLELFNDKGESSEYLENQIQFLNAINEEIVRTNEFTKNLAKLDVFVKEPLTVQAPDGTGVVMQDFWLISVEKFSQIPAQELEKLNKDGTLGWVFFHMASLINLGRLMDRHMTNKIKKA